MIAPAWSRRAVTAALIGLLVLGAGCGGEDETGTPATLDEDTVEFDLDATRERFEKEASEEIDAENLEGEAEALQRELDADEER